MSENKDHYNHGGLLAFVFSMAFVFAFFFYIVFIYRGIDLKENLQTPSADAAIEEKIDLSQVTEPWVESPDLVKHGTKLYAQNCAMCHGAEGKGDGAAGAGLNPKPRNLVTGPWKKGGGLIGHYTVLTEGLAGSSMASYAHLKPIDRWALVHFIQSITQAKPKEDLAKVADFAKAAK
jgi:mono/diheme cytochrome c family protein